MIKVYRKLFEQLDKKNIFYCSWKSNHLLKNFLNGEGDLDLYLDPAKKSELQYLLLSLGFKKVKSYVADFPFVAHYIGLDDDLGKLVHLHVYFKFVTGESNSKNYILPIDRWIKDNCEYRQFNVPTRDAQLILFLLRYYIKIGSFFSLFIFLRDKKKYSEEWHDIQKVAHENIVSPVPVISDRFMRELLKGYVSGNLLIKLVLAVKLKAYLHGYARKGILEHTWFKFHNTIKRIFNKLILKRKKVLDHGVFVAICGLDGSGKSTAVDAIKNYFSKEFSVKVVHMGRPKPTVLTLPLWSVLRLYEHLKHGKLKKEKPIEAFVPSKSVGTVSAIRYAILAYERYRTFKRASLLVSKGIIVVSDRYPSINYGKMDSPRVFYKDKASFIYKLCHKFESWCYSSIAPADLVLHLTVPVEIALERNQARDKSGKETDNEIRARYLTNSNIEFKAGCYLDCDATKTIKELHQFLFSKLWERLS